MVFRSERGLAYKTRVTDRAGRRATCSTGCRDQASAEDVERFVRTLRARRRWDVLAAIVDHAKAARGEKAAIGIALADAYDADVHGRLDAVMRQLAQRDADPDLAPMVAEWGGRGRRGRTSARYVRQVRVLIPEGEPFPASRFTRRRLSEFLSSLAVDNPTKNRYRAALMQFGHWLVEREVLDTNPVRDVAGFGANDPRKAWYPRAQARALVEALPEPYRALEALMAGTGMEWQAVARLRRRDIDLDARTVFAHGTKNRHRRRTVVVTEPWAWAIVAAHVQPLAPSALVFPVTEKDALAAHHAACAALGLPDSVLHDWRHTYTINALRDGVEPQYIRPQLGHSPSSTEIERVYGAWIPSPLERRERAERRRAEQEAAAGSVTTPATTRTGAVRRRRA